MLNYVYSFWTHHSDQVLSQVLTVVTASAALGLFAWVRRIVWQVLAWIGSAMYWALIGWWVARIRRWITGSPW